MHNTQNDLPEQIRRQVIELLNARLADALDLRMQAKQAHWNVKGPHFIALHELFDKVANHAMAHVDLIAERITALGGVAIGTVQQVSKHTTLSVYPTDIFSGREHCEALSESLAAFGKDIRQAIDDTDDAGDAVTADLFTGIAGQVDQDLWFVEAHVQAPT